MCLGLPTSRLRRKGCPAGVLDGLAAARFEYRYNPALLQPAQSREPVSETWHTDLFRSLCPVTGQPDWASIVVSYTGRPIVAESLLAYLVSFREHACFHEDAIERIYIDIQQRCRTHPPDHFGPLPASRRLGHQPPPIQRPQPCPDGPPS